MQTKLLIASLAALSHRALANNDIESGVERQARREDILQFIEEVALCDVDIDGEIKFNQLSKPGDQLEHQLEFTLKNFENCPGMRVEAWVEDHDDEKSLEQEFVGKKVWTPEEVNAINNRTGGATNFKYKRQTSAKGGTYKGHVRVFDKNFDLDKKGEWIPLLSVCEDKIVPIKCPTFQLLNSPTQILSDSPETVSQMVNFRASDPDFLELCEIAAVISVYNEGDPVEDWVQEKLKPEKVRKLVSQENEYHELAHKNKVGKKKCVQVDFQNVNTEEKLPTLGPQCLDDTTPDCVIQLSTKIDKVTPDYENKTITVDTTDEIISFDKVCLFRNGGSLTVDRKQQVSGANKQKDKIDTIIVKPGTKMTYTSVIDDVNWPQEYPVKLTATSKVEINGQKFYAADEIIPTPCSWEIKKLSIKSPKEITEDSRGVLIKKLEYEIQGFFNEWCGEPDNAFIGTIYGTSKFKFIENQEKIYERVSSKAMEQLFQKANGKNKIVGTFNFPMREAAGNYDFVFKMQHQASPANTQKTVAATYTEVGLECELAMDLVPIPPYLNNETGKVVFEATYKYERKVDRQLLPVDVRYCELDILELKIWAKDNYGNTVMEQFFEQTKPWGDERGYINPNSEHIRSQKQELLENGYPFKMEFERQDLKVTFFQEWKYKCEDDNKKYKEYCSKIGKPGESGSAIVEKFAKYENSCNPKVKSVEFFDSKEGAEGAQSYFTYELGGSYENCGCPGADENDSYAVTYDVIRQGNDKIIGFSPKKFTKEEFLAGIRPPGDEDWKKPRIYVDFTRDDGKYQMQMTFEEFIDPELCTRKNHAKSTSLSNYIEIINKCEVFISSFEFVGSYCGQAVEEIRHKFKISYSTTKYCKYTTAVVQIDQNNIETPLPLSDQSNYEFDITQKENLKQEEYSATAIITSEKKPYEPTTLTQKATGKFYNEHCNCEIKVMNHVVHLEDEGRQNFDLAQSLDWTAGKYCYGKNLELTMAYGEGSETKTKLGKEIKIWHVDGEDSGKKCANYSTYIDGTPQVSQQACVYYDKPCVVNVSENSMSVGWHNPAAFTGTYLDVALKTITQGNCGASDDLKGTLKVTKKLDCEPNCDLSDGLGLVEEFQLTSSQIQQSIGNSHNLKFDINDDGDACYQTEVVISAEDSKGARTKGAQASPSDKHIGMMKCTNIEKCEAKIDDFDWASVPVEENNWVTPRFTLKLSVDKPHSKWCQHRKAKITLKDGNGFKVGEPQDLNDEQIKSALAGNLTYDWSRLEPQAQRLKATLEWGVNSADDTKDTIEHLVEPKCHLEVKDLQISSPNLLSIEYVIEYDVNWTLWRNNFCKNEEAKLRIYDLADGEELFEMKLSQKDIEMSYEGMAIKARFDYVKKRAGVKAQLEYYGNEKEGTAGEEAKKEHISEAQAEEDGKCDIKVTAFQLNDIVENPTVDPPLAPGQYFDFDILIDVDQPCGKIDYGMDIFFEGNQMASIDRREIRQDLVPTPGQSKVQKLYIPTANKGIMAPGEYYGQIDIRESKFGLIVLQDSQSKTFP